MCLHDTWIKSTIQDNIPSKPLKTAKNHPLPLMIFVIHATSVQDNHPARLFKCVVCMIVECGAFYRLSCKTAHVCSHKMQIITPLKKNSMAIRRPA